MRSPLLLLLTAFLFKDVCLYQQNRVEQVFQSTITNLKLSPVPPEAEGLPSPPVPEFLDTEYEVHGAPATSASNFILQPVSQGTRPSGTNPTNIYGPNDHYFINQQGHLVLRPQRPQYGLGQVSGGSPPLNFHELPPSFPHLTDEELYMLGQPVPLHQNTPTLPPESGEETSIPSGTGLLSEAQPSITNSSLPTIMLVQPPEGASSKPPKRPQISLTRLPMAPNQRPLQTVQPSEPSNQFPAPSYEPSPSQKLPPKPPSQPSLPPKQPSVTQSGPVGEYIATVSYGLSSPSLVYTCSPIPHHSPGRFVQGPLGYSCKMFKARPSLAAHLLATNNQKPVTQPIVTTEPVSLPIFTPINFFDAVH